MSKETMKLALEALDNLMYWDNGKSDYDEARKAIKALEEALAKQEQGKRTWVGLTDEEFHEACWASGGEVEGVGRVTGDREDAVRWAINKLKEKNTSN
jgi:hypothetical protein